MFDISLNNPKTIEDYEPIVAVYNKAWPDNLGTAKEWQQRDKLWPETHLFQRMMVKLDGQLIVEGVISENHWAHVPGKYSFGYSLLPEAERVEIDGLSVHDAIYEFVLSYLAERQPIAVQAWEREDKTARISWLRTNGFKETMRYQESELDVQAFDGARYDDLRQRLTASGIEFVALSDLQERDPDWQRNVHKMCNEIEVDIPSPDPATPEPFEQFVKTFSDQNFLADAWFIAIDTTTDAVPDIGTYAGITMLGASQADAEKLYTWLTGVRRPYRRRGIALAAKVYAIEYAQQRGIKVIGTDNEENNPMYQINLNLGFKSKPPWIDFEKKLVK